MPAMPDLPIPDLDAFLARFAAALADLDGAEVLYRRNVGGTRARYDREVLAMLQSAPEAPPQGRTLRLVA
jgi:hypothetical protein